MSTLAFGLTELTDKNYKEETKKATGIVTFYTDWCPACKHHMPIFKKLEKEFPTLKFMTVDVDAQEELGKKVRSIPTTFFLIKGKIVGAVNGTGSEEEIKRFFDQFLKQVDKLEK